MKFTEEQARKQFKDHEATVVLRDENFFVLDWRNRNGEDYYFVRYLLDIKQGCLTVSGDVGYCVACWFNEVTPENLAHLIKDVGYFTEKLACATNSITYKDQDQMDDLNELEKRYLANKALSKDQRNELEKNFARLLIEFDSTGLRGPETYPPEVFKLYDKIDLDWENDPAFTTIGKRTDKRILLWSVGYRMAIEQLTKGGATV